MLLMWTSQDSTAHSTQHGVAEGLADEAQQLQARDTSLVQPPWVQGRQHGHQIQEGDFRVEHGQKASQVRGWVSMDQARAGLRVCWGEGGGEGIAGHVERA